jgi:hypothetical protein
MKGKIAILRIHTFSADMINNMRRFPPAIPVLLFFLAVFPLRLQAEGTAADSTAAEYKTGRIDPKILELPIPIPYLLEHDPAAVVERTVRYVTADTDDPYRIVKRIHDWIVNTVEFNEKRFLETGALGGSPIEAVRTKTGLSKDFALLFEKMCGIAEIEAVVIRGFSNRYYTNDGRPAEHYWNGVRVNGHWYIVDTAEDAKGGYSDRDLFPRPEAKVLTHLPEDDRYQFLAAPVSVEEFLGRPLLNTGLIQYGILPLAGFDRKEERFVSGEWQVISKKVDSIPLEQSIVTLRFSKPKEVYFLPILRDAGGKIYPRHAAGYEEDSGGTAVVQFSLPGDDPFYEAAVFAADDREGKRELLYTFHLPGSRDPPSEMLLPEIHSVYSSHWLYRYGCGLEAGQIGGDETSTDMYRSITVRCPEDVELRGVLEDAAGNAVPGAVHASSAGVNRVRFTAAAPAAGRYFLRIEGRKKEGDRLFKRIAETSFIEDTPRPGGPLPAMQYLFREQFFSKGFQVLGDNFHRTREEGCYRMVFQAPPEYRMDCSFAVPAGENVPGTFVYERYDDLYYFYFLPPENSGGTAEIYSVNAAGVKQPVCSVFLEPLGTDRDYVYAEGWLYRKNGLEDLNVRVSYENIHLAGQPGYAVVELEKPADVRLAAAYETPRGEDRRKGNVLVSTPDNRRKTYFFRLPREEAAAVTIFAARPGGTANYDIPLIDFMLYPDSEQAGDIPPPGEIIFYEQFLRNGFAYVSDTLPDIYTADFESYELQIRYPQGALLDCKLYREDGTEVPHTVRFTVREDRYIFTITPPKDEANLSGRVLYYNREGQWQTMCWFLLPAGTSRERRGLRR